MRYPFVSWKGLLMLGLAVLAAGGPLLDSGQGRVFAQEPPVLRPVLRPELRAVRPPGTFSMPDVTGLTVEQAEQRVLEAGRPVGATSARATVTQRRTNPRPAGEIIEQIEPVGRAMAPYGDDAGGVRGRVTFGVVLSTGPALAPDYRGQEIERVVVLAERRRIRLSVGDPVQDARTPPGIVLRQDPEPGQPMTRNQLRVWPSDGYPLRDYRGRPAGDAEREAQLLGFELFQRAAERLDTPAGIVFDQRPPPGTLLPFDGPVVVFVSRGWPMPELVELDLDEAREIAASLDLRLAPETRENFRVPRGVIFDQRPGAGEPIPPDRAAAVAVSAGYPLPGLVGRPIDEVRALAGRLEFELAESGEPMPDQPPNHVGRQDPEPGALLPLRRPVRVVVSEGWPTPEFIGRDGGGARALAAENDVALVEGPALEHFDWPAGRVAGQQPEPGTTLPPDRRVTVTFSLGWPVAPDAVGRMADEIVEPFQERHPGASVELRERGLTVRGEGTVLAQEPAPNAKLGRDRRLVLVVAGPKPAWAWAVLGALALAGLGGAAYGIRKWVKPPPGDTLAVADELGGVSVRVTRDPGRQTVTGLESTEAEPGEEAPGAGTTSDAVEVRVIADLGEQAVGPVTDEGDSS